MPQITSGEGGSAYTVVVVELEAFLANVYQIPHLAPHQKHDDHCTTYHSQPISFLLQTMAYTNTISPLAFIYQVGVELLGSIYFDRDIRRALDKPDKIRGEDQNHATCFATCTTRDWCKNRNHASRRVKVYCMYI